MKKNITLFILTLVLIPIFVISIIYKSLKEEIKEKIFQMQQIPINKKVLMSGENGTAKSSLALGIMTYNLKPDEVIIYIDVDNSGLEIVQNFYSKQ